MEECDNCDGDGLFYVNDLLTPHLSECTYCNGRGYKMQEQKLKTKTKYFAKKNSIYAALRFFEKSNDKELNVIASWNDRVNKDKGSFELIINKDDIVRYLGYDFKLEKERLKKDKMPEGKLYHKKNILELFEIFKDENTNNTSKQQ
jgi:hypothetical protein